MTERAPRHHTMVDFLQYSKREWVVLEEDHVKALAAKDARIAELQSQLNHQRPLHDPNTENTTAAKAIKTPAKATNRMPVHSH